MKAGLLLKRIGLALLLLVAWAVAFGGIQLLLIWGLQSIFLDRANECATMMAEIPKREKVKRTRYTRIPFNEDTADSIFSEMYLKPYYSETFNISTVLDSLYILPCDTILLYRDQIGSNTYYISHTDVPAHAYCTVQFRLTYVYEESTHLQDENDSLNYEFYSPVDKIVLDSVLYTSSIPDVFLRYEANNLGDIAADHFLQLSLKDDTIRAITTIVKTIIVKTKNYEN